MKFHALQRSWSKWLSPTAGGFSAKPTLQLMIQTKDLMCVHQHPNDILKALFSFLVDVRLYWTCVDAKQNMRWTFLREFSA